MWDRKKMVRALEQLTAVDWEGRILQFGDNMESNPLVSLAGPFVLLVEYYWPTSRENSIFQPSFPQKEQQSRQLEVRR
jgi:hypothetical protein